MVLDLLAEAGLRGLLEADKGDTYSFAQTLIGVFLLGAVAHRDGLCDVTDLPQILKVLKSKAQA